MPKKEPLKKKDVLPVKESDNGKIKATYYITENANDDLEEFVFNLKKKFKKRKVTRSKIIEIALNNLIQDWKKNQDNSQVEKYI